MRYCPFFCVALWLSCVTLVHAQSMKLTDGDQPIHIQANIMTLDDTNKISTFEGNVRMTQGSIKITANKVQLSQDAKGMSTIHAWGKPVSFEGRSAKTNKLVQGWSDEVVYKETEESIVLMGNARILSEGDEIRAQTIRYFRSTGEYKADGAKTGSPVFVTIQPRKKEK